ncbi:MAG TPA: hypothetical protein VFL12_04535, partial [Thermoanaerobaculia bacterium]|nr:hypothetical protein [Thermoanaerobaculia bacterium]
LSGWAFDPDGYSCNSGNGVSHIDVDVDGHYVDINTQQPCGVPCPPTGCTSLPNNCEPASPGSSFDHGRPTVWCQPRFDVPINDVRVPPSFQSPNLCGPDAAAWPTSNLAEVGWYYASFDTTMLSNGPHDLNVYASDCSGHRTLIGRRRIIVFNDPSRQKVSAAAKAAPAPAAVSRHP